MSQPNTLIAPVSERLKDSHLLCHADGHQWRHEGIVGAPDWMPPFGMVGAIARHSICTSCGTERARWYTRSGEVLNRYRHPEGYLHKRANPEDVSPSRLDYRRTLAIKLFDEAVNQVGKPKAAPKRSRKKAAAA